MNKLFATIVSRYKYLDEKELPCRWGYKTPIFIILIYLVSFSIFSKFLKAENKIVSALLTPQIFLLVLLIFAALFLKIKLRELGLSKVDLGNQLTNGIIVSLIPPALIIVFILAPSIVYQFFAGGKITILSNFAGGRFEFDPRYFVQLLILAPFVEEIFFRGFLIPPLKKFMPLWGIILFSSLIFMLAHGYLKIGAFLLGIFTSVIFISTGSIIPTIIFHFSCNLWGPLLIFLFPEIYKTIFILFK